jgi:hypothetical protein
MTEPPDHRAMMGEYTEKVAAILPILEGVEREVRGAVLAELTARWLASEEPFLRDMLLTMQWMQILRMVPFCEWDIYKAEHTQAEGGA